MLVPPYLHWCSVLTSIPHRTAQGLGLVNKIGTQDTPVSNHLPCRYSNAFLSWFLYFLAFDTHGLNVRHCTIILIHRGAIGRLSTIICHLGGDCGRRPEFTERSDGEHHPKWVNKIWSFVERNTRRKKNIELERQDNLRATVDKIFTSTGSCPTAHNFGLILPSILLPFYILVLDSSSPFFLFTPFFSCYSFSFWTLYLSCICHFLCIFRLWWKREGLFLDRPGLIFGLCIFIFFVI